MAHTSTQSLWKAILTTALLAGTLDGLSAVVHFFIVTGKNPSLVFRYIASGVLGESVMKYDLTTMASLGVLFHYCIATSFTIFFFLVYPRFSFLRKNKILTGVGYGLFVWVVMNRVVVPLSNVPHFPFSISKALLAATILIFMIGLPISLMAHRYYSSDKRLEKN